MDDPSPPTTTCALESHAKQRRKRFAAKVRTGCDDCRRRRVKCDETRPHCLNCRRMKIECKGYSLPEPKFLRPKSIPAQAGGQFGIIDNRITSSRPSGKIITGSEPQTFVLKLDTVTPSKFPYYSEEQQAAFDFYLNWTAPMLSSYGPNGGFWQKVVPRLSYTCPAIRSLLLAAVNVDERWLAVERPARKICARRAFAHYSTGLRAIVAGQITQTEAFIGALMGWTVEAMLFDYECGELHLRAAERIMNEMNTSGQSSNAWEPKFLFKEDFRDILKLMQGYTMVMAKTKLPDITFEELSATPSNLPTIFELRERLSKRLTICKLEKGIGDASEFLRFLTVYENTDRLSRYISGLPQIVKEANHLLFNIAMTLLLTHQPDAVISLDTKGTVDYVLLRIESILRGRKSLEMVQRNRLDEIIRDVLHHVVELFPENGNQSQVSSILSRISEDSPEAWSPDFSVSSAKSD